MSDFQSSLLHKYWSQGKPGGAAVQGTSGMLLSPAFTVRTACLPCSLLAAPGKTDFHKEGSNQTLTACILLIMWKNPPCPRDLRVLRADLLHSTEQRMSQVNCTSAGGALAEINPSTAKTPREPTLSVGRLL